ncbi:hypothetical protein IAT40_002258 [Kwoniella sp. CBS 6097]
MRIHLPLHASQFAPPATSASSSSGSTLNSPLITLGGDLVLIELQGELNYEGDLADGVIGVIGLDRPDKPTLHLGAHHLLHGKFVTLQKPYAVIRRVVTSASAYLDGVDGSAVALEGDAAEEDREDDDDDEEESEKSEEEEEEEGRLFEPNPDADLLPTTPRKHKRRRLTTDTESDRGTSMAMAMSIPSSSPMSMATPRTPLDYSSELDMSSPARSDFDDLPSDTDEDENDEGARQKKKSRLNSKATTAKKGVKSKSAPAQADTSRTRHYEVVGVVRKKVVFALRPEPLVAPTVLPE